MIYECVICKVECETRDKRSRLCGKIECRKVDAKEVYKNKIHIKKCKICNKEFGGTFRMEVCSPECFRICAVNRARKNGTIDLVYKCKHCGLAIETITKVLTNNINANSKKYTKTYSCEECKITTNKKRSESRMGRENPNWKEIKKDQKYTKVPQHIKDLNKKSASERMIGENNPMKRKQVREQVSFRWKELKENGFYINKKGKRIDYIPKIGKNHKNYRGTSSRQHTIRHRLYAPWVFPVLLRDNFKCTICERKNKLEVHHIIPLRDIIQEELIKYNKQHIDDLDYQDFELLVTDVLSKHTLDIGMTVCSKCHGTIDEHRKQFIKNEN